MGWFDSFIHPEKGYEKSQEELNKYYQQMLNFYNQGQGYITPYQQGGVNALNPLYEQFTKLISNPEELHNKFSAGYQESPYAKQLEGMATERGLNAAQSLGLKGSNTALSAIQQGTTNIANQDRQQYMQDLMQKYLTGLGVGQNIFNTGANAAGQLGNLLSGMGNNAMNMGQNSAQNAFNAQNAPGNLFGGLLGMGGSLLGSYLGGKPWNAYGGR